MDVEFHQLDRRYEELRATSPERDQRVLSSLARIGQQLPVVVVAGGEDRYILVDGYKRVRALVKLRQDTIRATLWELDEAEALLLGRLMRSADGDSALEQGWLLRELRDRFGLSNDDLARRFDRSTSWVSRRLGLVGELPVPIQQHVREGRLVPHAAMKFLLPLARANRRGAVALAEAIAPLRPTTRQTAALCVAFARGGEQTRQQLLAQPEVYLRVRAATTASTPALIDKCPATLLTQDLGALGGIARRASERVQSGAVRELLAPEHGDFRARVEAARREVTRLFRNVDKELEHAGRADENGHPEAS